MNYNLLLFYLSELEVGKWERFREGFNGVKGTSDDELYPSVVARHLSVLGHLEFDFDGKLDWSVSSAVLACLPPNYDDGCLQAVLCGKRTRFLTKKLRESAEKLDCTLTCTPQKEGTDRLVVTAPTFSVIEEVSQHLDMGFQPLAAQYLANVLPPLQTLGQHCKPEPEPLGYPIERYDGDKCKWETVEQSAETGLYRYNVAPYDHPHRLKRLHKPTLGVSAPLGIYLSLQEEKKRVWHYDATKETLTAPASAILPPLYARVLVLCTGLLPDYHLGQHIYRNIPQDIARPFLRKLGQEEENENE